jgi:hypothetical protein
MERWILIVCYERPELTDLHGGWQKEGIFVCTVTDVREATSELLGDTDYLLVIIFFRWTGVPIFIGTHTGADKSPRSGSESAL